MGPKLSYMELKLTYMGPKLTYMGPKLTYRGLKLIKEAPVEEGKGINSKRTNNSVKSTNNSEKEGASKSGRKKRATAKT